MIRTKSSPFFRISLLYLINFFSLCTRSLIGGMGTRTRSLIGCMGTRTHSLNKLAPAPIQLLFKTRTHSPRLAIFGAQRRRHVRRRRANSRRPVAAADPRPGGLDKVGKYLSKTTRVVVVTRKSPPARSRRKKIPRARVCQHVFCCFSPRTARCRFCCRTLLSGGFGRGGVCDFRVQSVSAVRENLVSRDCVECACIAIRLLGSSQIGIFAELVRATRFAPRPTRHMYSKS